MFIKHILIYRFMYLRNIYFLWKEQFLFLYFHLGIDIGYVGE